MYANPLIAIRARNSANLNSLLVPTLYNKITRAFPRCSLSTVDLFHQSTVKQQGNLLLPNFVVRNSSFNSLSDSHDTPERPQSSLDSTTEMGNGVSEFSLSQSSSSSTNGEPSDDLQDIAVIGIAGKFPGAQDADEFYKRLMERYDGISTSENAAPPVPEGAIWVPKAGILSGVEEFDHEFWNLSKGEATDMDPQQRLFLETALHALDDAGIDTSVEHQEKIGIFVGAAPNVYHTITKPVWGDAFQRANRGMIAPCISARTAYHLNLHGPNVTLNTNCASSTVALSLAVDQIHSGRCTVAIVGGVSVQLFGSVVVLSDVCYLLKPY